MRLCTHTDACLRFRTCWGKEKNSLLLSCKAMGWALLSTAPGCHGSCVMKCDRWGRKEVAALSRQTVWDGNAVSRHLSTDAPQHLPAPVILCRLSAGYQNKHSWHINMRIWANINPAAGIGDIRDWQGLTDDQDFIVTAFWVIPCHALHFRLLQQVSGKLLKSYRYLKI